MTDPRGVLDVIRQRADNATDGPWSRHDFGHAGEEEPSSIVVHTGRFDWADINDPAGTSAVAWMGSWDSQEDADAEFIAAARSDVPRLVAALTAVLDELDEWGGRNSLGLAPHLRAVIEAALTEEEND